MKENGENFTGIAKEGFKAATEAAVRDYEKQLGVPQEPVTLRVVEMYVTVHNPIHDYRVVLGPSH